MLFSTVCLYYGTCPTDFPQKFFIRKKTAPFIISYFFPCLLDKQTKRLTFFHFSSRLRLLSIRNKKKCIFFSIGYTVAVILNKPHYLVRKGFPADLTGVIVHRLSFLFSSILRYSIFVCALAFLKFSPVIQTGEHISVKGS